MKPLRTSSIVFLGGAIVLPVVTLVWAQLIGGEDVFPRLFPDPGILAFNGVPWLLLGVLTATVFGSGNASVSKCFPFL